MEDSVRLVGQAFSTLGVRAPKRINFRLQRQLRGYKRLDPAPTRIKPIPWRALQEANRISQTVAGTQQELALTDLMWIAYYFLLWPGKYLHTSSEHAFCLTDVIFRIEGVEYNATAAPIALIQHATFAGLAFTEQNNGVKGEMIGLAPSGDMQACAVRSL